MNNARGDTSVTTKPISAALLAITLTASAIAKGEHLQVTVPIPLATVVEVSNNGGEDHLDIALEAGERALIQWSDDPPLSPSLKLPSGETLSRSSVSAGANFLPASTGKHQLMRALFPDSPNSLVIAAKVAGIYTLLPRTSSGRLLRFRIYRSNSPYHATLIMATPTPLRPAESRTLAVALTRDNTRLNGATVKARVLEQPHQQVHYELMLNDDGYGADRVAADGIYSTALDPTAVGRYVLLLTIELPGSQGFKGTLSYQLSSSDWLADDMSCCPP